MESSPSDPTLHPPPSTAAKPETGVEGAVQPEAGVQDAEAFQKMFSTYRSGYDSVNSDVQTEGWLEVTQGQVSVCLPSSPAPKPRSQGHKRSTYCLAYSQGIAVAQPNKRAGVG